MRLSHDEILRLFTRKVSESVMEWVKSYRKHVSGEQPIALLMLILKVCQKFRTICFGLAALVLGWGIWTALTVDMKFGASMGLIIFPGIAIFISLVGIFSYGVAELLLSPARHKH
ncbi:hypothetical protein [Sphingobium chungangianum]